MPAEPTTTALGYMGDLFAGYIFGKGADGLLGPFFQEQRQRDALDRAIKAGLTALYADERIGTPLKTFFNERFIENHARPVLATFFTRDRKPDPQDLTAAFREHVNGQSVAGDDIACTVFLEHLEGALKKEEVFRTILDSRGIDEVLDLVRGLTEGPPRSTGPIHHVPHQRTRDFIPRPDLLRRLREAFAGGDGVAAVQAVKGLGGVGKTQLALWYVDEYRESYDLIWWMQAEQPATLLAQYTALAPRLELPEMQDEAAQRDAVRDALAVRGGWLLVFDNVPKAQALQGYLPGGSGHVIVTSRHAHWHGVADTVSVDVMSEAEAVDLLLARSGSDDRETAALLAHDLGCLPLALAQAADYMAQHRRSLADYRTLFAERSAELLAEGTADLGYPHTVATTWSLSFDKVAQANEAAAQLLQLAAFLAPESIPLDLLAPRAADHLPAPLGTALADPLARDRMAAALGGHSLAEWGRDDGREEMTLHRLVQQVTRARMDADTAETRAAAAANLVAAALPRAEDYYGDASAHPETWPLFDRLQPHALAAADHAAARNVAPAGAAALFGAIGAYRQERADWPNAETSYQRALVIGEAALGPDHPTVAGHLNNLAQLYQATGRLTEAEPLMDRALAIDKAALGPDHPTVAIDLNNLAWLYQDTGRLAKAERLLRRAVEIAVKVLGEDHPHTQAFRANLDRLLAETDGGEN